MGGGPQVTGVEQLSGTMEGSGMYGLRGRRPSELFWATAEGAVVGAAVLPGPLAPLTWAWLT